MEINKDDLCRCFPDDELIGLQSDKTHDTKACIDVNMLCTQDVSCTIRETENMI